MNENPIYAPNIHLFAYHLQTHNNQSLLYQKCEEVMKKLKIDNFNLQQIVNLDKDPEKYRVDLLKESAIKNGNVSPPFKGKFILEQEIKFEGFAYPLRIHDTYALALNIRLPEEENREQTKNASFSLLKHFNPDNCLLPDSIGSSLGQTLLITARLPEELRQEYCDLWQYPYEYNNSLRITLRELADSCINNFINGEHNVPKFYRQGELFGSPIFEYGTISDRANYKHILVWLFTSPETEKNFGYCYQDLIDLFCYRHQIIQCYIDSCQMYRLLDEDYQKIEQEIDKFQELTQGDRLSEADLKQLQIQLKNLIKTASSYTRLLRDLSVKAHKIAIEARNYKGEIRNIRSEIEPEDTSFWVKDISFLENFLKNEYRQFQEQIRIYLTYVSPGSGLLDLAIASIRGIVEIEQTRINRSREEV